MGALIGSVRVLFQGDTGGIDKAAKDVVKTFDGLKSKLAGGLAIAGGLFGAGMVIDLINKADDAAGAIDTLRKTFGDASADVETKAVGIARAMGEPVQALAEAAARAGQVMQELGVQTEASGTLTTELLTRAADVAGAWNISTEDALGAFNDAIKGRTRGLKEYGIVITEQMVNEKLLALGAEKLNNEWTDQQKTLATMAVLFDQTKKVAGEGLDESQLASKQIAQAFADIQRLGQDIVRFFSPLISLISRVVRSVIALVDAIPRALDALTSLDASKLSGIGKSMQDIWSGDAELFKQTDPTETLKKQIAAQNEINKLKTQGVGISKEEKKAVEDLAKDADKMREDLSARILQLRTGVSDQALDILRLVQRGLDPARARELAGLADQAKMLEDQQKAPAQVENRFAAFTQAGTAAAFQLELAARSHVPGLNEQQTTAKNTTTMVQQFERLLAIFMRSRGGLEPAALG